MTRAQFLNDLYRRLAGNGMDADQAEQHLTYYAEMLADRMEEGMGEDQAVGSMEDVDTIARRILEEEGLSFRPVEELAASPAGGGGKRAWQTPRKWDGRRLAQIALWGLAAAIALGAAGRWLYGRGGNTRVDYTDSTPVAEAAPYDYAYEEGQAPYAEWSEDYAMDAPYAYGYEYAGGENHVSIAGITAMDIQWAAGTVFVQTWNGDEIRIQEYARTELTERNAMLVEDKGDTLSIRFRKGTSLGSVKGDKWLTVLVPDGVLEELDIAATSASVQLNGLEQGEADVSTASGYISLTDCYFRKTELESISGDVTLSGVHGEELDVSTTSGGVSGDAECVDVEAESISGDVNLYTMKNTEKVRASTTSGDVWVSVENTAIRSIGVSSTSGDVSLSLPYDMGFTLDCSSVSGGLNSSGFDMVTQDGKHVYNGGGCEIEVDTVSGDLNLY